MYSRSSEPVRFERDCAAVLVPQGDEVNLPAGSVGYITQALGGSYTVFVEGNLFRIAGKDADAIGKQSAQPTRLPASSTDPLTEDLVWAQLREVYDPEIPINVVDLGLVYDLQLHPLPDGKHNVLVQMTLTAQGCGMGPSIARDAQRRIETLPNVAAVDVRIVWDPQWHPDMMSAEGKKRLGVE